MECKWVAVFAVARFRGLGFIYSTESVASATHDVEALEREARRVNLAATGGATGVVAMLFKLLTDGDGTADVGLDGGDRRRDRVVRPFGFCYTTTVTQSRLVNLPTYFRTR